MPRSLEMSAEFAGEEFAVKVDCSADTVRIRNGGEAGHGKIVLSWDDLEKVLEEVERYKVAAATMNQLSDNATLAVT